MQELYPITQYKYAELSKEGVIDYERPEPGYGDTINSTLYDLLSKAYVRHFNFDQYGPNEKSYLIYDHIREYSINLNNCADKKGNGQLFRINFSSQHNTIDHLKEDIKKDYVDNRFLMFIANPRLYKYTYAPENPHFEYLSIAHVEKDSNDYKGTKTWSAIHQVNDYMLRETGQPLFFTLD